MDNVKSIYYWAPFIDKVATIRAVYNSVDSINKYSKGQFNPRIINVFGEWEKNQYFNDQKNIFYKLTNLKFINSFSSKGFLRSRIKYILIFFICLIPLKNFLSKQKPDFLIIHLITSLPLFLNTLFNFKTKFILRISGKPKLNIIRSIFWKISLKKVYKITFPTKETLEHFKTLNIANESKFELLYDPILNVNEIKNKIKHPIKESFLTKNNFYLSVGRLTKQKNYIFLINQFKTIIKNNKKDYKLVIIGTGEDQLILKNLIYQSNLSQNIYLLGYKENVYNYMNNCKAFILSSLWEDPGFVIAESIFCNALVLSSDCSSGPKEILSDKKGLLFKNNNKEDFISQFQLLNDLTKDEEKKLKINAKKFVKNFSLIRHFNKFKKILK